MLLETFETIWGDVVAGDEDAEDRPTEAEAQAADAGNVRLRQDR